MVTPSVRSLGTALAQRAVTATLVFAFTARSKASLAGLVSSLAGIPFDARGFPRRESHASGSHAFVVGYDAYVTDART